MMDRFLLRAQLRAVLPGGVLLHASSVAENNGALVFLAPSGGGKSTVMSFLSRKLFGAIADDSLVISRGTDGVIRCLPCGSMKQGTGIENIQGAALKAIFFLEKGAPFLIEPIDPCYAFYRAMRYAPLMAFENLEEFEQKMAVSFLEELFASYPSYILKYDASKDPSEKLAEIVYG